MIRIDSNAAKVAANIKQRISAVAQGPALHPSDFKHIMATGTRKHFSRLGNGRSDGTALEGSVRWPRHRSRLTLEERGDGGFPLLRHTGSMARAWSTGSRLDTRFNRLGSTAVLRSPGGLEGRKGRVNQRGGRHMAHFPRLGVSRMMLFPARKFRYWDTFMLRDVKRRLLRSWAVGR